ncbi:MAG: sodium-dependent transporter [Candidatus Aminicenantales bacterium]
MGSYNLSQRGRWSSKIGFIFAATGSAIGLGNIWGFPMMVGKNGGAVFVLVYILCVALIGFTVMLAELVIGRHTQKNPVGAFQFIKPHTPWKLIGYLGVITGVCILSYYSVIAGWAAGYFFKMISGAFKGNVTSLLTDKIFTEFTSSPVPVILCFFLVICLTTYVVSRGVKGGIERWTKVLMPMLFLLMVFLAIRALSLPGAGKGISFYLNPDFSKFNGKVILFAMGQAFFSLSLGMGAMLTYGSYISKSDNLVSSAGWVSFSDTLIAILAGFIIFPTLFAIPGIAPSEGPGLVFKVFPLIFSKIPGGLIFGTLFFILLLVAALTSTISLLEVPVAYFIDERGWNRQKAALIIGLAAFLLGIPSALSSGGVQFLTRFDFMTKMHILFGNISLAVGSLCVCVFVGWIWGIRKAVKEVLSGNPRFMIRSFWGFSTKFLSPVAILIILIFIKILISG